MINRIPPQNIESEEAVITSCLLDGNAFEEAFDVLDPADFYKTIHQTIFDAFVYLFNNKQPIDLITATNCLRDKKKLDEIGGATYLAKLTNTVPIVSNVKHHAEIIKKKSTLRDIIKKCSETMQECFEQNKEYDEIIDDAQNRILNINSYAQDTFYPMSKLVPETIERLQEMKTVKCKSLKTGFAQIDRLTGGLGGAKFIIIAARPKVGKTSFMLNMVMNMAKNNHKIDIFSIEMGKDELMNKMFAAETYINSMRFAMGSGPRDDEWGSIDAAADRLFRLNINIDDTGGLDINELKRRARKRKKEGAEIIFIDQLSKIRTREGRSIFEKNTFIVNELAQFKKEIKIPIVLLTQISRKADDRADKQPTVSDLKNTGSLEEDLDILFLGHREYEYTKDPEKKNEAYWDLNRQRGGPTRIINMHWNEKVQVFNEIEP